MNNYDLKHYLGDDDKAALAALEADCIAQYEALRQRHRQEEEALGAEFSLKRIAFELKSIEARREHLSSVCEASGKTPAP